jgi:hypothetical protein
MHAYQNVNSLWRFFRRERVVAVAEGREERVEGGRRVDGCQRVRQEAPKHPVRLKNHRHLRYW